jgi:cell division initiation protein
MKLTPLDIHHKEFRHALRGYSEEEVDAFLDEVADEFERLFKENIDLSEKNEALEVKVRDYQDMERTLHNTLMSAQRSADEIMAKASTEADAVMKDAELKAKDIIHNALTQKQKATNDLARVKQAEEEFRTKMKSLLEQDMRELAEIPVPEDIKLMVGQAGDETLAEAEVYSPPAEPAYEPAPSLASEPASVEPPDSGYVASLHLGEMGGGTLEPDTTLDFDAREFGLGEREDDVDIEEID